jgi:hypothetical protein
MRRRNVGNRGNGNQQIHSVSGQFFPGVINNDHERSARLKLLTLSYFNHTAGRRFLPFGITAISIWFGDYFESLTQGVLQCDMQQLQLQFWLCP